jgi:hypothetical protein
MFACMRDKGWAVEIEGHGLAGPASGIPDAQRDAYKADLDACTAKLGYNTALPTVEEAGDYYDKLLASAECLRGLGYEVSEPPSRQLYAETLAGGKFPDWDPYSDVRSVLTTRGGAWIDTWTEVNKKCPHPVSW